MVIYMWGKDVANALLATEAVSEDCEAVMDALGRVWPLRMPVEFRPIDKPQKPLTHDCPNPDASMALREAVNHAREAGNYTTWSRDCADPTSRIVRRDYVDGKLVRTY